MATISGNSDATAPITAPLSSIRPVSRRLPASKEIWDDTNLPLAVVITPGADASPKSKGSKIPKRLLPLSAIPKCLECGAPHPTRSTHYRPLHHSILLCYLCGKTSSTRFEDQYEARHQDELPALDPEVYDRVLVEQPSANAKRSKDASMEFDVPLVFEDTKVQDDSQHVPSPTIWSLPAMVCPPVFWIVLDGTSTSTSYWKTAGNILNKALEDVPPFVHIGMVTASSTTVSSWTLSSPLPHVVHSEVSSSSSDLSSSLPLCLVPANDVYLPHVLSALRAVADHKPDANEQERGMALGATLETIAEFMTQNATHPGLLGSNSAVQFEAPRLKYAGGKILCLLNHAPAELQKQDAPLQPHFGNGGAGGSCATSNVVPHVNGNGDIHDADNDDEDEYELDPTDLTPANLQRFTKPLNSADYFGTIGKTCAEAALGVDILIISSGATREVDHDGVYGAYYGSSNGTNQPGKEKQQPWFGVPFLANLSHRSGAMGPLLFEVNDVERLQAELMARVPWKSGLVYGAALRIRISPGFVVDDQSGEHADIEPDAVHKSMHLAACASSQGLTGPAVAISDGPDDDPLWLMGTCDRHTTVTIDLAVQPDIKDHFFVEGFGEVALRPVIQTCFVFTSIEYDDGAESDDGAPTARIVRKMRVTSVACPLSQNVEAIYNLTDPEALGVILYQKLAEASMQDGWMAAYDIGNSWLRSLLICVHQSAEAQIRIREDLLREIHEEDLPATTLIREDERLVNHRGGSGRLSESEIALGFGHEHIRLVPFLVFALLQSEVFQANSTSSLDARAAAMAQMATMPPPVLSRCIAPGLQLWSASKDCITRDMVDLSRASVRVAADGSSPNDSVFLVDSPSNIIVAHARNMSTVPAEPSQPIQIGATLKKSIDLLARSYRAPPTVLYKVDAETDWAQIAPIFDRVLIEDRPNAAGIVNYERWKEEMAKSVITDLEDLANI